MLSDIKDQFEKVEQVLSVLSSAVQSLASRQDANHNTVSLNSTAALPSSSIPPTGPREIQSPVIGLTFDGHKEGTNSTLDIHGVCQKAHETHFLREEARDPLPCFIESYRLPTATDIMELVRRFFDRVCPLYPIICEAKTYEIASCVVGRGFRDDTASVLIILIIALTRACDSTPHSNPGLGDFQYASHLRLRLGTQFTLEMCQIHILSALFMLDIGRILDCWSSLQQGATVLQIILQR